MSKILNGTFLILILTGALWASVSAQTAKRVEAIEKIYAKTTEQIAESNADGEYSSTFLAEMTVNKNNGSYPAVGIFRTVYKFYYTYGDREKNPYPNRLLKIEIETARSDRTEKREFLFNDKAQLIYYFESKFENEKPLENKIYFQNETGFKFLSNEKKLGATDAATVKAAKFVLAEKRKLVAIFQNSLMDY